MKRIVALVLVLAMCLVFFTSCEALAVFLLVLTGSQAMSAPEPNEFFAPEYLIECNLEDVPVPTCESSKIMGTNVYLNMSDEEFVSYSQAILEYLLAKEDAYFKGYQFERSFSMSNSSVSEYRYAPLTEEYKIVDENNFIFSLTELLNEKDETSDRYYNGVIIDIVRFEGTLEYKDGPYNDKKYSYNAIITIKHRPNDCVYCENSEQ